MDQSNSTSKDATRESTDSNVLKYTIALGLLTGLSLKCTSLIFKLDKDLGQIIVYPIILLAYIYLFRNYLPKVVIQVLLSTLILLVFSFFWTQGDFGTGGVSYISKRLLSSVNPRLEDLRAEFNRDSEALNFPKLETIYRNFDDKSAEEWGRGSYRLLVYSDPSNPRLKLFIGDLDKPQKIDVSGMEFRIQLFPEWIPIDPQGIPVDYLTTLVRVLPSLEKQSEQLQKLEDLGFTGYAAGMARGRWNSPAPRAAALLLGASANLAKDTVLGKAELKCIRKNLMGVLKKTRVKDSPEVRSLALNNLGVVTLKLGFLDQPAKAVGQARRFFSEAIFIRSFSGQLVNGAKLATANLFVLDGAGLTAKIGGRKNKLRSKHHVKQTRRHLVMKRRRAAIL